MQRHSLDTGRGVFAGPANPRIVTIVQPDGTTFQARPFGDEWHHGMETADGYTILRDSGSGWWSYAQATPSGRLVRSIQRVGTRAPVGVPLHLRNAEDLARASQMHAQRDRRGRSSATGFGLPDWFEPTGTVRALIILVEFADQKLVSSNASDWAKRMFKGKKSVAGYYKEVSYKALAVKPAKETHGKKNDGVVNVTLDENHPGTGGGNDFSREIAASAIQAADRFVDFTAPEKHFSASLQADELAIVIILAGYENSFGGSEAKLPSVWGHAWSFPDEMAPTLDGTIVGAFSQWHGYQMYGEHHEAVRTARVSGGDTATIGVMVHEMGHDFGLLPDLYDTDESSEGIGQWGAMGSGAWLGGKRDGDTPCHLSAWSKSFLGWVVPMQVTSNGTLDFPTAATSKKSVYRLGNNPDGVEYGQGQGEYFLLENRQPTRFDKYLPGSGLLIWHIEESPWNNEQEKGNKSKHRLVDLEEADGKDHLDKEGINRGDGGDPFPGDSNNRVFAAGSKPGSKWYSKKASGYSVTNISSSKAKMTAKVETQ